MYYIGEDGLFDFFDKKNLDILYGWAKTSN